MDTRQSATDPMLSSGMARLSARNVLLRQKLMERKRYDSADDAMKKAKAPNQTHPPATSQYQPQPQQAARYQMQPQSEAQILYQTQSPTQTQTQMPDQTQIPNQTETQARLGQSAFFNAMESGAAQGRNVLIQRKLKSKSSFDSADYQMAKARRGQDAEDVPMEDVSDGEPATSSPCPSPAGRQQYASMSPSRTGKYGALENKAKPSRRELLQKQQANSQKQQPDPVKSKYGKLSAANILIRRQLKERKRFDSADYAMEKQGQPTDVPADVAAHPAAPGTAMDGYASLQNAQSIDHQVKHIKLSEDPSGRVATPAVANAAQAAMAARQARYAGLQKKTATSKPTTGNQAAVDRYGIDKSSAPYGAAAACNVVINHKMAERKVFDSGDHFRKAA